MNRYWELMQNKVESMPLRERMFLFVAMAFIVIALTSKLLLNPLLEKQKGLSAKLLQQQEQMKALQATVQALSQARQNDVNKPLRESLAKLKLQLEDEDVYIKGQNDHLVDPGKIASLLEQVLNKNGKLQVVALENLPVSFVAARAKVASAGQKSVFKHGVRITLRGNYLDLLQYLAEVEKASVLMYWDKADFNVDKLANGELVLNLYTLSLDKAWLKV